MYLSPSIDSGNTQESYLHDKHGPKEREVLRVSLILSKANLTSLLLMVFGSLLPVTHFQLSLFTNPLTPSPLSLLSRFPPACPKPHSSWFSTQ